MKTPICDFINEYIDKDIIRLHMPGHKGKSFLGFEKYDITEFTGADSLYDANGIIKESELNATKLFGSEQTLYSCEGSSLCIRAMLYLAKMNSKSSYVFAGRNAHSSFISACALNDLEVMWLFPNSDESYLSCTITGEILEKALGSVDNLPCCVYVTSPDYLGNMCDISALSRVCKKYGVPLLVDNAHGAYLRFLNNDLHPITMGADMCCDSAHKTLPVITGGAYLHISKNAPSLFKEQGKGALALFGSTSPSYLILASLDNANKLLSNGYGKKINDIARELKRFEKYSYIKINEPLKLTIEASKIGHRGQDFAKILENNGIMCEFYDKDFCVLMVTPENDISHLDHLEKVFAQIEIKEDISKKNNTLIPPERKMSIRKAIFSKRTRVPIEKALGRTLASPNITCPPAVSLIVCGEEFNESIINLCKSYGINSCYVVE
ncbi:MAG: aminotransferase class I/II-fold pyridoxal phosphate-dependent enzyme [Clostridia bacterium]|nr:aminotransferase class I/II-fold pyridoxal phosphate-dependent enzyme [Clostridia bacterium]